RLPALRSPCFRPRPAPSRTGNGHKSNRTRVLRRTQASRSGKGTTLARPQAASRTPAPRDGGQGRAKGAPRILTHLSEWARLAPANADRVDASVPDSERRQE